MRAAWFNTFGEAKQVIRIGDQPDPKVMVGEVLVKLSTTGINPSDVKKRAGAFSNLLDQGLVIPHSDGAGEIVAVGAGVSKNRIGERVWIYQAQYERRFGTAASLISIDARRAVILPQETSLEIGACLGIPAMTAHRCVFSDGVVDAQHILITGGAGRVGGYAIQWAKLAGAKVISTASNEQDKKVCEDLGADIVINHRDENWDIDLLDATKGTKIDRVVDVEFGRNLPKLLNVLKVGATIATYSSTQIPEPKIPFLRMMYMDLSIRLVIVYAMPENAKSDAVRDITAALEKDQLSHRIAHILPLDSIAHGHELIESGNTRGCVVVNIS
ncbi:MAG: NADPH:quinone reductase [Woeseiaceae bacterium]|nr:NADPH:quinone reductase [Woeseiaceae bacterium]MDG1865560.1 NADPH:quinone reductase [Woeseiaceae bacterium]